MIRASATPARPAPPLSARAAGNVRAEAARRGLTQADMAGLLGMSRMAVSDRYRGRTPWTLDELSTVAGILRLDVCELIRGGGGAYLEAVPGGR